MHAKHLRALTRMALSFFPSSGSLVRSLDISPYSSSEYQCSGGLHDRAEKMIADVIKKAFHCNVYCCAVANLEFLNA